MNKDKKILIVDDCDMDRTILKAMLCDEFEIVEKCGGYTAVDFLKDNKEELDVLMLDISMPGMDGFGVLQFMKEAEINIPVFLITAEATRDNVRRATQYGVAEFIRKPFDRDYIVKRIQWKLGIVSEHILTSVDVQETNRYISELQALYKRYLINFGEDHEHYSHITDLMRILLSEYAALNRSQEIGKEHIEIISKAGYFCDIGNMIVPPESWNLPEKNGEEKDDYQKHTVLGADIINMNHSNHCRFFVDVCTDICMHHHERCDGKGFPHGIIGEHNLIYTQICRIVELFDRLFMKCEERSEQNFDIVLSEIEKDEGNVSKEAISLLTGCRADIISYYQKIK